MVFVWNGPFALPALGVFAWSGASIAGGGGGGGSGGVYGGLFIQGIGAGTVRIIGG